MNFGEIYCLESRINMILLILIKTLSYILINTQTSIQQLL